MDKTKSMDNSSRNWKKVRHWANISYQLNKRATEITAIRSLAESGITLIVRVDFFIYLFALALVRILLHVVYYISITAKNKRLVQHHISVFFCCTENNLLPFCQLNICCTCLHSVFVAMFFSRAQHVLLASSISCKRQRKQASA